VNRTAAIEPAVRWPRTLLSIGALAALLVAWGLGGSSAAREGARPAQASAPAAAVAVRASADRGGLESRVRALTERQAVLAREVEALRRAIQSMKSRTAMAATAEREPKLRSGGTHRAQSAAAVSDDTSGLDERQVRLQRAGFSREQAIAMTRDLDEVALERMNLRYRAAQEGWLDSPEFAEALEGTTDGRRLIRDKYGDAAYDRYLYASLKPNRLVVKGVMAGSPAAAAGLRQGDMIVGVNGQRVYGLDDLTAATLAAGASASVAITVRRGDAEFVESVPPGPLGIHGGAGYAAPER